MEIKGKTFELLIPASSIEARVNELASRINIDFKGKSPVVIVVLNGAYAFATDLLRKLELELEIAFVKFVSYEGLATTGTVDEVIGLDKNIHQRDVLIIEDIVDTGLTMTEILRLLKSHHPTSIEIASLLFKPASIKKEVSIKYIGFEIAPDYVIGYGLDFDGLGRNLPEIYRLQGE
ncbi:MAG: hypoxanthine phosphoribosyltransferase [Cytophagales bacterium]|nr:hypoxanthine phosphoribosyltransferase [Cytophagales bacterium]